MKAWAGDWLAGVDSYGNVDGDIVGGGLLLEVGLCLDHEFDFRFAGPLDDHVNGKEWPDLDIEPVGQQLEISIRRNERDDSLVLEHAQADAGMEFHVVK